MSYYNNDKNNYLVYYLTFGFKIKTVANNNCVLLMNAENAKAKSGVKFC